MSGTRVEIGSGDLDLLEILRRGPKVWNLWREKYPNIDIDLSCANLSYANLSYANLSYANLSYANLSYANLSYANLKGVNLKDSDLSSAILYKTDLSGANLRGADLKDADFNGANLSGSILYDVKTRNANFRGAKLDIFAYVNYKIQSLFGRSNSRTSQDLKIFKIRILDSDIDNAELQKLITALDKFAEATGYDELYVTRNDFGSFFRDIRYKIARFISDDIKIEAIEAGQEAYRGAKANVQQRLEKPGVDSTKQIADATAALIAQVDKYDNAVVQAGKIIILKVTDERGQSRLYTRTVSSELQLLLERSPQLIDNPQDLLRVLNEHPKQLQVLEDDKTLPPQTEAV